MIICLQQNGGRHAPTTVSDTCAITEFIRDWGPKIAATAPSLHACSIAQTGKRKSDLIEAKNKFWSREVAMITYQLPPPIVPSDPDAN